MSEQRRLRNETRQGLHQFLMRLYMSFLETMKEEDAKALVRDVLEEQYSHFSDDSLVRASPKETLTELLETLKTKLENCSDFDEQMRYAEQMDAIEITLHSLDMQNTK